MLFEVFVFEAFFVTRAGFFFTTLAFALFEREGFDGATGARRSSSCARAEDGAARTATRA